MKHRASKSLGVRCFPCPLSSHCLPDRKRKRFLASARNDDAGRRHTPSFPWKEVPRRGGGWLPKRDEKNGKQPCSRFVIPSAAEGSFSFAVFFFLCTYICMKHRASKSLGVRCFPCPLSSHCLPDRKRKRFLASARNDDAGRRHTPSFPWKEGVCPEGAEVGSLPKRDEKMGGARGKAATFSHKKTSHLLPRKDGLFFYNVRPISTAICLSLSGERPAMVR